MLIQTIPRLLQLQLDVADADTHIYSVHDTFHFIGTSCMASCEFITIDTFDGFCAAHVNKPELLSDVNRVRYIERSHSRYFPRLIVA